MEATCDNPRPGGGCRGSSETNQCLWTINVPRPGGSGWVGDVCIRNVRPTIQSPPPPRPGRDTGASQPPFPPPPLPPPPARDNCEMIGYSEPPKEAGAFDCPKQASCLDVSYNSKSCVWREFGRETYLYCQVISRQWQPL